ncbi:hypothetical protein ACSBR2_025013 [Camellia fascicularis]
MSAAADFTHSPPSTLPPTSYLRASVSAAVVASSIQELGTDIEKHHKNGACGSCNNERWTTSFWWSKVNLVHILSGWLQNGLQFCATGSLGFKNNLPLEEIVEQLIVASPQTCAANIGKGYGDDWEGEFFPGIPKIKYESPSSKSPLAFKWYNAEEEILGKKMSVFPFSLLSLSPLSQLLLLFLLLRWCLFLGKILGFLLFNLLASHPTIHACDKIMSNFMISSPNSHERSISCNQFLYN